MLRTPGITIEFVAHARKQVTVEMDVSDGNVLRRAIMLRMREGRRDPFTLCVTLPNDERNICKTQRWVLLKITIVTRAHFMYCLCPVSRS